MNKLFVMIGNAKYKILVWLVVFLAALNIATLISIYVHVSGSTENENQIPLRGAGNQFSGRSIRDALQFSGSQMEAFRAFNPEFRKKVSEINLQLNTTRDSMFAEMTRPKPDTLRLNQLALQTGQLHTRLKLATYKYYFDIKAICQPGQIHALDSIFSISFNAGNTNCPQGGGMGMGRQGMGRRQHKGNN